METNSTRSAVRECTLGSEVKLETILSRETATIRQRITIVVIERTFIIVKNFFANGTLFAPMEFPTIAQVAS
jgi:hypothetical protein